jgi:hypothetical protein
MTEAGLEESSHRFAQACKSFEYTHPGSKSLEEGAFAASKIDLDRQLDSIEERDVRFILNQFGWEFKQGWGASSNGWLCPATIGQIDLWFHEMTNPTEHGVPEGHTGFYVQLDHRGSPAAIARWIQEHKDKISWGLVLDGGNGRLIITRCIDLTDSPTLAAIKQEIEEFVANIAALHLPKARAGHS